MLLLPPHPTPLAPLRASPCTGVHFLHHLPFPCSPCPFPSLFQASRARWPPPLRAHASGEAVCGGGAIDALLSAAELLCLAPPAICSVVCAARLVFTPGSANPGPPFVGGRLLIVQYMLLVGAVAIGTLIRRRQRERLRGMGSAADQVGVGLAGRVDKLEESVRGVVAAVRVLSRTVEKLGIRFRVLRRTLRDPISETATLAQKNSEATRILAAQKKLLEKEIGAMQKVLYAMQEQQQKQLELILAIGEASNVLDDEQDMLDGTPRLSSKTSLPETRNKKVEINTQSLPSPEGNNKP